MKEITMLQEGIVKITDQWLLVGTESYGISNIRSVQRTKQTRSKKSFVRIAVGILLALCGTVSSGSSAEFYGLGILIMIVVIVVFLLVKPPYTIQIETTSKNSVF